MGVPKGLPAANLRIANHETTSGQLSIGRFPDDHWWTVADGLIVRIKNHQAVNERSKSIWCITNRLLIHIRLKKLFPNRPFKGGDASIWYSYSTIGNWTMIGNQDSCFSQCSSCSHRDDKKSNDTWSVFRLVSSCALCSMRCVAPVVKLRHDCEANIKVHDVGTCDAGTAHGRFN